MTKNVKISKREIKEDKFTTFMLLAKDYVLEQWIYVVGAVAAIIIIILGITFYRSSEVKDEAKAAEIASRAMAELSSRNYQTAIVDFKSIVDEYGSTSQAEAALFELGNAYYKARNFTEAKAAYEQFIRKYDQDTYFTASALAGIAACLAGSGDLGGAADKYREAAEKYPTFELAGDYYTHAMYYYLKSGNRESARVIYAKITKDFPGSRYITESQRIAGEHNLQL